MEYCFNFDKIGYVMGDKPTGCILCLLRDRAPEVRSLEIARTGGFIVCLNLYPYNPGHLMIFPARHVEDIRELGAAERAELDSALDRALRALDAAQKPSGFNVGFNMGLSAGASIEHLHMHVIPRYPSEIGIAELIMGKRVLVEDPLVTREKLRRAFEEAGRD